MFYLYLLDRYTRNIEIFPEKKNFILSEDIPVIFVFHMWRYQGCHDYVSLSKEENTIIALHIVL